MLILYAENLTNYMQEMSTHFISVDKKDN